MPVNKVRRNGSFAPLSAQAYKDDALMEAGEAAELLFYRALSFGADVLRDGFMSETQVARVVGHGMRDALKRADRLVEVGLWKRAEGGYWVRSWLKWNRSREEIEDLQSKDTGRKGARTARPSGDTPQPQNPSERNPNGIQTESEPGQTEQPNGVQTDSNASRAGLRPRTPSLQPTLHTRTEADASGAPVPSAINAGTVVGAWVDAFTEPQGRQRPSESMRKQAGKQARDLLEGGARPELVLEAAKLAGAKGYATLDREYAPLLAPSRNPSNLKPWVEQ